MIADLAAKGKGADWSYVANGVPGRIALLR